jgi:threonine/homoserine/homoserine lactone efflux protein
MDDALVSLVGFSVATSITPGPNNVMVAASAANYGMRATVPLIGGIALGFAAMLAVVCLGLAGAISAYPTVSVALRWIMAVWLVVFAWKIANAAAPGNDGGARPRPIGFVGAALFQWVNPKAWLIALGASSEWLLPEHALLPQVALISFVFLAVATPCVSAWAALGGGARQLLRSPGRLRLFNIAMAALLVASVIPMLGRF